MNPEENEHKTTALKSVKALAACESWSECQRHYDAAEHALDAIFKAKQDLYGPPEARSSDREDDLVIIAELEAKLYADDGGQP